ncbi:hypothetical protein FO519_009544, partial [Halicephalobus sp. NKZ332]
MEFECSICFTAYSTDDEVIYCSYFNGESNLKEVHATCLDCIKGLAKAAITDAPVAKGGIGLPCPAYKCENVLLRNNFESHLDYEINVALSRRLQEEAIIAAEMDDLVTCPGCHMKFCVDSNLKFYDCHCGRRQCRNCPRVYDENHENVSCLELDELDRQNKLEPKLSEIVVRVCHRCKLQFVKGNGCNKMTCRCGAKQCYLCRQPVEDYSHFCECGWNEVSGKCPTCSKACPLFGDPEERDRIQMNEVTKAFNATMKTTSTSFNLFIRNFGEELNDRKLHDLFKQYGEIISHAVMKYFNGKSKGFGFVAFADSRAAESAIEGLNGYVLPISKKTLYVAKAQKKNERQIGLDQGDIIAENKLFIANLDKSINDTDLEREFQRFGNITSANVARDGFGSSKGFGFVCFENSWDTFRAIQNMNNKKIRSKRVYVTSYQKEDRLLQEPNKGFVNLHKNVAKAAIEDGRIASGGVGLACPLCENVILLETFQLYLDPDVYHALMKRLQQKSLSDAGFNNISVCPGCNSEAWIDGGVEFYDCPCGRRQCRYCPRAYDESHIGVPCAELDFQQSSTLESTLSEIVVRVCPNCKLQFIQQDGCNKMQCRCGTKQCYICKEIVTDYSHFCRCGWKGTNGRCPTCHKSCPLYGVAEQRDEEIMGEMKSQFKME